LLYLSLSNRALGADRDLYVRGWDLAGYVRMLAGNGWRRTLKTVGRKALGIDRRYEDAWKRHLGAAKLPDPPVRQADICALTFPANRFDFVYCRSVIHQVQDPSRAVDEMVRVLRPGGILYATLQPFTAVRGSLDPRIFARGLDARTMWAHLRPRLRDSVHGNAVPNQLRLSDWNRLFRAKMPECNVSVVRECDEAAEAVARELLIAGELNGYSLTELLAGQVCVSWKKPAPETE
jgi:SAM-dependent methyltransferase